MSKPALAGDLLKKKKGRRWWLQRTKCMGRYIDLGFSEAADGMGRGNITHLSAININWLRSSFPPRFAVVFNFEQQNKMKQGGQPFGSWINSDDRRAAYGPFLGLIINSLTCWGYVVRTASFLDTLHTPLVQYTTNSGYIYRNRRSRE